MIVCFAIHPNDRYVIAADDEEGRRLHIRERRTGKVRTAAARDDGGNGIGPPCRCHKRRSATGTCAEEADLQGARPWLVSEPLDGTDQPVGEQTDVKSELRRPHVDLLFFVREQIDQKGSDISGSQLFGDVAVPRTETAAATPVREEGHTRRLRRDEEVSFEDRPGGADANEPLIAICCGLSKHVRLKRRRVRLRRFLRMNDLPPLERLDGT